MRLRRPKSFAGGKERSNNDGPSQAHFVVSEGPSFDVIHNETKWHAQYEQNGKATDLASRDARYDCAEDESESYYGCAPRDNSKDE